MTAIQMTALHEERLDHAASILRSLGGARLLDLGCGLGALLYRVLREPQYTEVVGVERCARALCGARSMLSQYIGDDREDERPRLRLLCGSYTERNDALTGFDVATMIETIEHVPPQSLSAVESTVFGHYRPRAIFMTTPNREYNPLLGLAPGEFRDEDHTFEWDRAKFRAWARGVAQRRGYAVRFGGIGADDPDLGPPTQTALFLLQAEVAA